ncbi:serine recombinase [Williamsia muralis]|uniref:serine recombinase n=1 Tax=Williamsia marianensis TaxID=85044 RepID=UPI003F5CC5BF
MRDAVLLWLYETKMKGHRAPVVNLEDVETTAEWAAESITPAELVDATNYLKAEGYIAGSGAFGGGIPRPMITSAGENRVAAGLSVRPGPERPANTTGVTNNYTVNTHAPTNVAIGSYDFTQTVTPSSEQADRLLAVADALDSLVASSLPAIDPERAQTIAGDLRTAAAEPEQDKNRLVAMLAAAIGTVATAAGSEVGQQVTELAVSAIQSLG